jgi:hypothetical protein
VTSNHRVSNQRFLLAGLLRRVSFDIFLLSLDLCDIMQIYMFSAFSPTQGRGSLQEMGHHWWRTACEMVAVRLLQTDWLRLDTRWRNIIGQILTALLRDM